MLAVCLHINILISVLYIILPVLPRLVVSLTSNILFLHLTCIYITVFHILEFVSLSFVFTCLSHMKFSDHSLCILQLIIDVNIAVAVEAIQAIGNLAKGLRTHFSGSSRFLLPVLLVI